ncbi:MAG: ATP-binding cassette domain-containing protein [Rhodospirillaceae bacterium]|nr:ATP-binding cassette domain-containing protein [Rhodospirillaceae bacterium]
MIFDVRLDDVSLAFGDQVILRAANLRLGPGERVCLIGRNGSGKSSTLKLLTGDIEPDEGRVEIPPGMRLAMLDQALDVPTERLVRDVVTDGMHVQRSRIEAFRALSGELSPEKAQLRELEALQAAIDAGGGWSIDVQVDAIISQLELPAGERMSELSGGWRRRVALAQALVGKPELLLLDEPTNHLDISTIEWLEGEVRRYDGTVLFVSHDRGFVERLATRVVSIDRGSLGSWPGGYRAYLRQKRKADAEEDRANALFDKLLAEEEVWIRRGIKARESRNEGRVRALEAMREQRAQRIRRPTQARIHINESEQLSGKKVIEVRNVTHGYGEQTLFRNFSLRIMRGDRIGIIGNNGVGKSTLLRILLGEVKPDTGSVKRGTHLQVAYFDQLRRELDTTKTVAEIVGEGRDYIDIQGRKKHVVGYLTDFLFSAKRAMTRVSALSGGERNRVILAKLLIQPANLLIFDEPTNDLDVETLEALESRLLAYSATLIVVSHDRYFLDRVVTSTLVFEGDGVVHRYAGGYSDWERLRRRLAVGDSPAYAARTAGRSSRRPPSPARKLTYKLQRELDGLPQQIQALEERVQAMEQQVNAAEFYRQPHETVKATLQELNQLRSRLEAAVDRWGELESQSQELR